MGFLSDLGKAFINKVEELSEQKYEIYKHHKNYHSEKIFTGSG